MMKTIKFYLSNLEFTEKSAPVAFIVLCYLSFGLLIPALGFYMDDWPYVFFANIRGVDSLREMLTYDTRPNAAWLYMLGFHLLGFKPIAWHISALVMRTITVTLTWLFFRSMWPARKGEAVHIALLFAVFPFFLYQPFAVGSTHHWFGFFTFNLSLVLMVLSMQTKRHKIAYVLLILGLEAAHLFTSEYFAGLELTRGVILWILISRSEPAFLKRVSRLILNWWPYVAILGIYAYWRVAIFQNPSGIKRNLPVMLFRLINEPLATLGDFIQTAYADVLSVLLIGWQKATDVNLLRLITPLAQLQFALVVITFGFVVLYLYKLKADPIVPRDDWASGTLALALAALLTAGLPIWIAGHSIVESKNLTSASRFGIPVIFGGALFTYITLHFFVTERKKKIIILSTLFVLAVNFHNEYTKGFEHSWNKQVQFSQQLLWRAPQIKPGTALLTDEEVLGYMGDYAVSFMINTAYQPSGSDSPPYWYFPFYYTYPNVDDLLQGIPLKRHKLNINFTGNSKEMLLLSFNPELNRCLWILQPQDNNLHLISNDMRQLSQGSNIHLIQQGDTGDRSLPQSIYGTNPDRSWCYYFEKADLARQFQGWDEIVNLLNEALSKGIRGENGFEYIPFIEGYGHVNNWERVEFLTKSANEITHGVEPSLCSALDRLSASTPKSQQRDETITGLNDFLNCQIFQ